MEKFKIGDKIKLPRTKKGKKHSFYDDVYKKAKKNKQDYLFIRSIGSFEIGLGLTRTTNGWDYYYSSDLEHYITHEKQYQIY